MGIYLEKTRIFVSFVLFEFFFFVYLHHNINLKQSNMKRTLFFMLAVLFVSIDTYGQEYSPLAWSEWQLWKSPYGNLALSKGDFLPYTYKTAFFPVKGYNHCKMGVYKARMKFGEITPDDAPFISFDIYYDDKGRVTEYIRGDKTTFGGINQVIINRNGDQIISESHYNSKEKLIGQVIYKYDEKKRISVIDLIDRNNKIYKKTKYSYSANGQTKRIVYNSEGEEICVTSDIKDSKGRLIKLAYEEGGSSVSEAITYNEKGLVEKISSSKVFVFNGVKDENYKGKLFDAYKYRYDQNGNVTDRLTLHKEFNNETLEWIRCEYSNEEDEVVAVDDDNESDTSNMIQDILSTSNDKDFIASISYSSLHPDDDENSHVITRDIDNDGNIEQLCLMKKKDDNEIIFIAAKEVGDKRYYSEFGFPIEKVSVPTCTTTILFHDFDNDGKNEVVFAWTDMGLVCGRVYRWLKPSSNSGECAIEVGKFSSTYVPNIDGNSIITKVGLPGSAISSKFVYRNNKLERAK